MNRFALWALALAGVAGCQSPLTTHELAQLVAGEHRWAARGFANYSIEAQSACFCPQEITNWARVEVVAGQVSRVTLLSSGEVITDFRLGWWPTVEQVFAEIRSAGDADYLENVEFTLDPGLGFPTLVRLTASPNVLDAGGTRSLRNAQPLP